MNIKKGFEIICIKEIPNSLTKDNSYIVDSTSFNVISVLDDNRARSFFFIDENYVQSNPIKLLDEYFVSRREWNLKKLI